MALLPRIRQLFRRRRSASTVAARHPRSSDTPGAAVQEDALRAVLVNNPNDEEAFQALADIVRRQAAQAQRANISADPLAAAATERGADAEAERAADLAVWALAEELAGHPQGWYPLVELGRLSLAHDQAAALRRFATAADRDPTGRALAESLEVLRGAGLAVEALGLGVGHWRARDHEVEAGRQIVLAALDAGRVGEAKHHLNSLGLHPDTRAVAAVQAELEPLIEAAARGRTR